MKQLGFTDTQLEQVRAVAATLRVNARDLFLKDLARALAGKYPPSDRDVSEAIARLIGVDTNPTLCLLAEQTTHADQNGDNAQNEHPKDQTNETTHS